MSKIIRRKTRRAAVAGLTAAAVGALTFGIMDGRKQDPEVVPTESTRKEEFKNNFQVPDIEAMTASTMELAERYGEEEAAADGFKPLPVSMPEDEQHKVYEICKDGGVSFPLVMALIGAESQYDPQARSVTGDTGYMQINDCNRESLETLGYTDLYDAEQNVGAGVYILADLFDKYGDDTAFVLMAYNTGEKKAKQLREKGTQSTMYVQEIMEQADEFSSYIESAGQ